MQNPGLVASVKPPGGMPSIQLAGRRRSTAGLDGLFEPLPLAPGLVLPSRIVMAPLTRSRAGSDGVPSPLAATYYRQRASAGLTVTEATQVSRQGQGYAWTPGIHAPDQVEAWKGITASVHGAGDRIFLQVWHVGRTSHPSLQPGGALPVAPSAVRADGNAFTEAGWQPFVEPRALEREEIPGVVADYARGAENARAAGFDGVELHAANGYLPDQFLDPIANRRGDDYGGTAANRARFLLEVVDALVAVWGEHRVGVRLSPLGGVNGIDNPEPEKTYPYAVEQLAWRPLAYLHLVEPAGTGVERPVMARIHAIWRRSTSRPLMVAGGYTAEAAARALRSGRADLVAFGRAFLANPDLPERIARRAPLNDLDHASFYGGAAQGYTDYPTLAELGVPDLSERTEAPAATA